MTTNRGEALLSDSVVGGGVTEEAEKADSGLLGATFTKLEIHIRPKSGVHEK